MLSNQEKKLQTRRWKQPAGADCGALCLSLKGFPSYLASIKLSPGVTFLIPLKTWVWTEPLHTWQLTALPTTLHRTLSQRYVRLSQKGLVCQRYRVMYTTNMVTYESGLVAAHMASTAPGLGVWIPLGPPHANIVCSLGRLHAVLLLCCTGPLHTTLYYYIMLYYDTLCSVYVFLWFDMFCFILSCYLLSPATLILERISRLVWTSWSEQPGRAGR